jgi:hypothetical protein
MQHIHAVKVIRRRFLRRDSFRAQCLHGAIYREGKASQCAATNSPCAVAPSMIALFRASFGIIGIILSKRVRLGRASPNLEGKVMLLFTSAVRAAKATTYNVRIDCGPTVDRLCRTVDGDLSVTSIIMKLIPTSVRNVIGNLQSYSWCLNHDRHSARRPNLPHAVHGRSPRHRDPGDGERRSLRHNFCRRLGPNERYAPLTSNVGCQRALGKQQWSLEVFDGWRGRYVLSASVFLMRVRRPVERLPGHVFIALWALTAFGADKRPLRPPCWAA